MNNHEPSIEVHNLTKRYGQITAIENLEFEIAKGEIVGFLGPNGAGKSTTMRILCGLIPATSGIAKICGLPVATQSAAVKRLIGYLPETNPLPEDMRVSEYLLYRGRLKEIPRRRLRRRVIEVMEVCDLERKYRRRVIGGLSKGFKQRVGVADALLSEPEVVILDEPTIGLDPHQLLVIRDLIANLRGRMTVILSSHILAEVEVSCDRVIILNQGRVVATGTPEHLRREFISDTEYELEVKGDPEQLEHVLHNVEPDLCPQKPWPVNKDGFYELILKTSTKEDLGEELLSRLQDNGGFRVRSIGRKEPRLEDIFLAATKKGWKELMPVIGDGAKENTVSKDATDGPTK